MKKILYILRLAILIFFCSCSSTNNLRLPEGKITQSNIDSLKGLYDNATNGNYASSWRASFWDQLNNDSIPNWPKAQVQLELNDKHIQFNLLMDSIVIKKEKFRYKLKDGHVVFRKNSWQGFPFIFYRYQTKEIYLTTDAHHNLTMSVRGESAGGILIIAFGSGIEENYVFNRREQLLNITPIKTPQ